MTENCHDPGLHIVICCWSQT